MREIKFRAWDKKGGKWFVNLPVCIGVNQDGSLNCFDDGELNQFSGIQDKLGNDIYEGDIILQNGPGSAIRFVEYRSSNFIATNPNMTDAILLSFIYKNAEVIGNVYESPELLTPNQAN